jgi:hypothetical protein
MPAGCSERNSGNESFPFTGPAVPGSAQASSNPISMRFSITTPSGTSRCTTQSGGSVVLELWIGWNRNRCALADMVTPGGIVKVKSAPGGRSPLLIPSTLIVVPSTWSCETPYHWSNCRSRRCRVAARSPDPERRRRRPLVPDARFPTREAATQELDGFALLGLLYRSSQPPLVIVECPW